MNKRIGPGRLAISLIVFAAMVLRASATVFTANTAIGPSNSNYDGQAIVISNCTVTIDGAHSFASLVVATNGILTHSFSAAGELYVPVEVTNAPLVLTGTNPVELASNVFSLVVTDPSQSILYSNGVDYLEVTQAANFVYLERTTNSSIPDGGTVLASYGYDAAISPVGLDLTVTGVVWVANGGEIDANGIGYGAGYGPGAGSSSANTFFDGSGGGDGGSGGMSLSNAVGGVCYDSLYQPALPGSGGGASYAGAGGNGGGLVQIMASGNVEIDGIISANGQAATNSRAGGGSGGGIWISAPSVSGAGSVAANGGAGAPVYGGGGGGGRIVFMCGTDNFAGTITAYGGIGANDGGAGTVFTRLSGQPGLLTLNNGGNNGANSTVTLSNLSDLTISNGASVSASSPFLVRNITVGTNGVLTARLQNILQFSASNLTVNAGAVVSVNGLGSNINGEGTTYYNGSIIYGGGGGYGGLGGGGANVEGNFGGLGYDYGLQNTPVDFGSIGGGGATGGGEMNVGVSGMLQDNGTISANGENGLGYAGGGGSGGSVSLTLGTLSGNGTITANGGSGANSLGGGGGGGRILVNSQTNLFSGLINCYGGSGANFGGEGSVYLEGNGAPSQLIFDNDGNTGPSTPIQSVNGANLIVQNAAGAGLPAGSTFLNVFVSSNALLTAFPGYPSLVSLTVLSNATIQAGGALSLDDGGNTPYSGKWPGSD